MTIDERLEALTMNVELIALDVRQLAQENKTMSAALTALITLVRSHEQRLSNLEG